MDSLRAFVRVTDLDPIAMDHLFRLTLRSYQVFYRAGLLNAIGVKKRYVFSYKH